MRKRSNEFHFSSVFYDKTNVTLSVSMQRSSARVLEVVAYRSDHRVDTTTVMLT